MGFSGDLTQMGALVDRLADLAEVPSRASAEASERIAQLIEEEFAHGRDPYEDPWQELSDTTLAKGRTPPPLTDTWAMRKGIDVHPMSGAGIAVTIGEPYAPPHQTGWKGPQGKGPPRPILPARAELPDEWQDMIAEAVDRLVRK
jgi:hypothetical protein